MGEQDEITDEKDKTNLSYAAMKRLGRQVDTDTGEQIQLQVIDTGEETASGMKIFTIGVGATGGGLNVVVVTKTIGEVTFSGSGLDDMTNGGQFTGLEDRNFVVEIDLAAGTDTFKWSADGGVTWVAEDVAITGADQTLQEGITIKFNATTGHTLGNSWSFTAWAADATAINKTVTSIESRSPAPAGTLTSNIFDARKIREAVITVEGTFDALATLGMTVDLYASKDGINFDTEPWVQNLEPTFSAGNLARITHNLDALPKYFRAVTVNLDGVKGITGVYIDVTAIEQG